MKCISKIRWDLFGKADKNKGSTINTELGRSSKYLRKYDKWLQGERKRVILDKIRNSFHQIGNGQRPDLRMGYQESPGATGIYIQRNEFMEPDEFRYVMDHIKDRVLTMNYKLQSSHLETGGNRENSRSKERYYLKPVLKSFEPPVNQEYGNILLDLEFKDGSPLHLKMLVTTYTGRNYKKPRPFEELAGIIFK